MPVALRRRDLRGFARHRIRARWHDHGRGRMADRNRGIDIVAVVGTVAGEGYHRPLDPVEQGTDLGAVVGELPPHWWTPLLSSDGSGKVSNGPGTASFYG